MSLKAKIISCLITFFMVLSALIVGVFAVKQTNFNVGGNINFTATGINATISQGILSDTGLWVDESDAEIKMQEVVLNTEKTRAEIQEEFTSWQDLKLLFGDLGEDVTIAFTITNTSLRKEYISVEVGVNTGTMSNATVSVSPTSTALAPGDVQEYEIRFAITDKTLDASLSNFKIDLDIELLEILNAAEYPTLTFTYDTTAKTASVKANTSNKPTSDLVLPSFVEYNDEVYNITAITEDSYGAFYNCTGLTSVTISNTITSIGGRAFYNCSNLTGELVIPTNATSIGTSAFYGCSGLTGELVIPDSVTSIGNFAFYNCSGLTSIENLGSVTSINRHTFYGCSGLTGELVIPDSVTTIWGSAFYNCSGLTSIKIPDSVTTIWDYAFYNCSGFTGELVIPDSVTTIWDHAFENCSGFTGELVIPDSVTSIEDSAFENCSGFTGELVIPDSVTSISLSAFANCSGFTGELVIPDGVTSIGRYAFENCSGLTSIEIPSSVTSIGRGAFYRNSSLVSMNYVGDINSWVSITFENSDSNPTYYTKSLTINGEAVTNAVIDTATSIKANSFYNCQTLSSVTIGSQVTSIGTSAFNGCIGLTSIEIPSSVTSIGTSAFYFCRGLTSINLPESVTTIGDSAFYSCDKLTIIIIDSATIAGALSGKGNYVCGGLIANATSIIYVKTDIVSSLNSYVTSNYTNVTAITEGEYAGYTCYSK